MLLEKKLASFVCLVDGILISLCEFGSVFVIRRLVWYIERELGQSPGQGAIG